MAMTGELRRILPPETLSRLPSYREQLLILDREGQLTVSSRDLAARLHLSDAQLRRDLSYLALMGRRGLGYDVRTLLELTTKALGLDRAWALVVVGAGAMGTALAKYPGFESNNMEVRAFLEVDPAKIGTRIAGIMVHDFATCEAVIAREHIELAVVAVPREQAQGVVDRLIAAGVRGFLNFAPAALQVPSDVQVRQVDISSELAQLTHRMANAHPPEPTLFTRR